MFSDFKNPNCLLHNGKFTKFETPWRVGGYDGHAVFIEQKFDNRVAYFRIVNHQ